MKTVLTLAHAALLATTLPLVLSAPASASPDEVVPLADVAAGGDEAVSFAGRNFFPGSTPASGTELWVSDGTTAGTRQVLDLAPGTDSSRPTALAVYRGRLYFGAWTAATGSELWSTDGTANGTRLEADINPGTPSSSPHELTEAGDRLYFSATDAAHGRELWTSDGTPVGTKLVIEIIPGIGSGDPSNLTVLGNRVVYRAYTTPAVTKPFVSGPGIPGARQLDPLGFQVDLQVGDFAVLGERVVFRAGLESSGAELWVSGGQPGDAHGVKDIRPGPRTSGPVGLTTLGDRVFFSAYSNESGEELWSTDGTEAGTTLVRDINPMSEGSFPRDLIQLGDQLLFSADDGAHGRELWATSGTAASTNPIADTYAGPANGIELGLNTGTPVAGQLLYAGSDSAGAEPWATDGRTARPLADLAPGVTGSRPTHAGVVGNVVMFSANDGQAQRLYGWTAVGSTTAVTAKRKYTARQARKKRISLPVTVRSAAGTRPSGGTVTLTLDGRAIGSAALTDGVARVRITVRLKPGKVHRVVAAWSGVQALASGSTSTPVKVRVKARR